MSVKSSNDELDEDTIDKSIDGTNGSNDNLPCYDDDEYLAVELMRQLSPAVLSKLRRCFRTGKDKGFKNDIDRRVEAVMRAAAAEEGIEFATVDHPGEDDRWIHEEKFVSALEEIFGHHRFTTHAQKLFQLLDPFSTGRTSWSKLVDRLVALGARKTRSRVDNWKQVAEGTIKKLKHCKEFLNRSPPPSPARLLRQLRARRVLYRSEESNKFVWKKRETIVKIVDIEREESFCYVIVTKGGRVGVYSGDLKLLLQYEVFYQRTGIQKRVKNCWITDVIYMSDVQVLVISASDRSLTFYDVTTLTHTPIYCITGMPHIPTCMAYCPSHPEVAESELALGTERGDLIRMRFLKPNYSLFHNNSSDIVNYYFWMELKAPPHPSYCTIFKRRVHARTIRRLIYTKDGEVLLSCSHDNKVSVAAISLPGRLKDYVFTVPRGVSCFHVVWGARLVAAGGADGVVRLFDVTQAAPHALLATATRAAVVDLAVLAHRQLVLAVCAQCMVHIWDMYEECLLQTIKLNFPFIGALGKKIEFGAYSIHPGPARVDISSDEQESSSSRRASSVMTATGGFMLQAFATKDWTTRTLEEDPEYLRFARSELLISCRDYICILPLYSSQAPLRSPPRDSLAARRPSLWDGPKITMTSPRSNLCTPPPSPQPATTLTIEHGATMSQPPRPVDRDLDSLLEKAGLQGILEKDFVLMQCLKYDLNRKLAEMETNMHSVNSAVNAGAPYLALNIYEPSPIEPADEMTDEFARVMRLFPGPSVVPTPSGSVSSTPRTQKLSK